MRRILCATDLSVASGPAWQFARRLAAGTGADVVVLHVLGPVPPPVDRLFDAGTVARVAAEGRSQARIALARLVEFAGDDATPVSVRVEDGVPAMEILAAAEREAADLIVVGTHGRTGMARLLLGSVAEQIVQLANRPVVTVRPLPVPLPPIRSSIRCLLFATDFSPASAPAWAWARRLAEATGAEIDLVHVALDVVPDRHLDPGTLARASALLVEEGRVSVERFLASCGLARDRIQAHVVQGVVSEQIVHLAGARQADLIVMGTHGRTGLLRLALGSVARRVLHAAPCPVLTVGPQVAAPA